MKNRMQEAELESMICRLVKDVGKNINQADESQWQYRYKLFDAIASTMEDRYAE